MDFSLVLNLKSKVEVQDLGFLLNVLIYF